MTQDGVVEVVKEVASRLAKKFAWGSYPAEDLEQQCFVWAIQRLPGYDGVRPLQNWLQVVLQNFLIKLRRDKFKRTEVPCKACHAGHFHGAGVPCRSYLVWQRRNAVKFGLTYPTEIWDVDEDSEKALQVPDGTTVLAGEELMARIEADLPPKFRADFLRMMDGAVVSPERRREVREAVKKILGDDLDG